LHVEHLGRQKTADECGGILDGRVFESNQAVTPLNVQVQLTAAQSYWSDRRLRLRHEWRLGHTQQASATDTATQVTSRDAANVLQDSIPKTAAALLPKDDSSKIKKQTVSKWIIFHEWTIARECFRYSDNNPLQAYYPPFRYSDSATFDSSGMRSQEHSIGLRKLAGKPTGSAWHVSTHYLNAHILSNRIQAVPQSVLWLSFAGHWQATIQSRVEWSIREVVHNSHQVKGRWMSLRYAHKLGEWTADLSASNQLRAADWVAERYSGNYTQVNQQLAGLGQQAIQLGLSRGFFQFHLGQKWLSGWVYYDSLGLARQHADNLGVRQISFEYSLRKGIFRYDLHHGWQFGQSGPLRLPQWMAHDVLSIEKRFRSGFSLSTGLELRMQSAYKALGYRPEVGQFVVQDTLNAGGYPLVDGFIALKVNQARIYLRMDHLSRGWTAPGGFQIPLYPLYDRALRFGISWDFYR
jgi:hypothetical protein